jgi:hypothetical protein
MIKEMDIIKAKLWEMRGEGGGLQLLLWLHVAYHGYSLLHLNCLDSCSVRNSSNQIKETFKLLYLRGSSNGH